MPDERPRERLGPARHREVIEVEGYWLPVRTRTKVSPTLLVSPGTRLLESDANVTKRLCAEIAPASALNLLPCSPSHDTLTRSVVPLRRSRTKISRPALLGPLVSPGTRLVASDAKATKRPSAE